jgi:peptidoglycan hydrolase CwlO-like protein
MADKLSEMLANVETELRSKYSELKALDQQIHARQITRRELDEKLAKAGPELVDKQRKIAVMNQRVKALLDGLPE